MFRCQPTIPEARAAYEAACAALHAVEERMAVDPRMPSLKEQFAGVPVPADLDAAFDLAREQVDLWGDWLASLGGGF